MLAARPRAAALFPGNPGAGRCPQPGRACHTLRNRLPRTLTAMTGIRFAAEARSLAATVRQSAEGHQWQRDRAAGHLEAAAAHLAAGREEHAVMSLAGAARDLDSPGGDRGACAAAVALRDAVAAGLTARQQAALAADDRVLRHFLITDQQGSQVWYSVYGTAAAGIPAGQARERDCEVIPGDELDMSGASRGARGFRGHARMGLDYSPP